MKPDYDHSIVNLMASLAAAWGGGDTGYAPLAELAPDRLRGRPVALLLIDGLGDALLQQFPDSHLARARLATLSSVLPSTTASAITTFATGVAPQQHAITGWHMWLRELGSVATILPFVPRHGGTAYNTVGWSPTQFIGTPPLYDRLDVPATVLSPNWITDSAYSRATGGRARRLGYRGMDDFFMQLTTRLADGRPQYVYAYWTELDSLAHEHGSASRQVREHFLALDQAFAAACARLRGSGALLLGCADHGFIDTDDGHTLQLADHPRLADTLAIPLCGEPRAVYCYLRPGREADFLSYARGELGGQCEAVASAELLAEGWFGHGIPHPRLHERIGDYVLLMKENYVLRDRLANERPFHQIGVHGGISRHEMTVPLLYREL
ncbi:MAG: alkaline phosphatase family protein [Thiohalomonadaceae bacterium]